MTLHDKKMLVQWCLLNHLFMSLFRRKNSNYVGSVCFVWIDALQYWKDCFSFFLFDGKIMTVASKKRAGRNNLDNRFNPNVFLLAKKYWTLLSLNLRVKISLSNRNRRKRNTRIRGLEIPYFLSFSFEFLMENDKVGQSILFRFFVLSGTEYLCSWNLVERHFVCLELKVCRYSACISFAFFASFDFSPYP